MGLHDDLERRFQADELKAAVERNRHAVEQQTRWVQSLDRPASDGPTVPGIVVGVALVVGMVIFRYVAQLPDSVWQTAGRATHRVGPVLQRAADIAIWFGLLWLVTWPVRRVFRRRTSRRPARP